MIVFYRNYKRSESVFYSAQSIKHFYPDMDIRCLMVYDESVTEYKNDICNFQKVGIQTYFHKKIHRYDKNGNGEPTLPENEKKNIEEWNKIYGTTGMLHGGLYSCFITEYLNVIYNIVKDVDDKVLILDEEQYFVTGETIKFLLKTEFDLAYGHYDTLVSEKSETGIHQLHANIQCINPIKFKNMFPIENVHKNFTGPEAVLSIKLWIPAKEQNLNCVSIPTRHGWQSGGYVGDGKHVKSAKEIIEELDKFNISYTNFAGVV